MLIYEICPDLRFRVRRCTANYPSAILAWSQGQLRLCKADASAGPALEPELPVLSLFSCLRMLFSHLVATCGARPIGRNPGAAKGHRYLVEVISRCVWLYQRFPLSYRGVEELILERGVIVSYATV